jgi:hypothetical protein
MHAAGSIRKVECDGYGWMYLMRTAQLPREIDILLQFD